MLKDADSDVIGRLTARVPDLSVKPAEPRYLEEPRSKWHGQQGFVATPATTEVVAQIVRFCAEECVGIVPYGGGTGLVSGQISQSGPAPLILSLERMTAIRAIYAQENALVVEAGATLSDIHKAADEHGRLFPLSYASKDSARIGGALSVNSGGLNVLRYGMARDLCLGVEAVLPDGQVFHGLKRLRKDNTGYDLRHLLIGSEGTLGIITAASLALVHSPANVATAFLTVPDPAAALALYQLAQEHAGEVVSAFELMSGEGFEFLQETHPDVRLPFDVTPQWTVLVELATGPGQDADATLMGIVETGMEQGLVLDGRLAQSGQQAAEFWAVRETIPLANARIGAIASHDISLPLSEVPGFIADAHERLMALADIRINAFGHLGDGNLHYNAYPPKGSTRDAFQNVAADLTKLIHDLTVERGGSFSAEHGIGRAKVDDLALYGDPAKLSAMRSIKSALDPLGIMNPGAVLP